jgi:hypothetical protein
VLNTHIYIYIMQGIVLLEKDEKTLCVELAISIARSKLERSEYGDEEEMMEEISRDNYVRKCQAMMIGEVEMKEEFFREFAEYVTCQKSLDLLSVYILLLALLMKYAEKDQTRRESLIRFLVSLLLKNHDGDNSSNHSKVVKGMIDDVGQDGGGGGVEKAGSTRNVRLRILEHIFNSLDQESHLRYEIFILMIRVALQLDIPVIDGGLLLVSSSFKRLPEWLDVWQSVTRDEKRSMYLLLRDLFRRLGNMEMAVESSRLAMTYIDDKDKKGHVEEARRSIAEALNVDQMFVMDRFLEIDLVKFIQGDPLYELLYIVVHGSLEEFVDFYSRHAMILERYGLVYEDLLRKMRLLSLVQLASPDDVWLSYPEVADALQIDVEEVETWIIDAIRFKLVEARLDQFDQSVWLKKLVSRVFETKEWHALADQIQEWNVKLDYMLDSIRASKLETLATTTTTTNTTTTTF